MALPLLAIGAEAAARAVLGHKGATHGKGLHGTASFGSALQQKLDKQGTGSDGGDLLAELASLLQTAAPPAATIPIRRRTLERALAAALAPPGTRPPPQTALEKRLTELVSKITRELHSAGQQSRFSGEVLDANSAREIPAQQQTKDPTGTQTPAGSLAFAESILKSVLQQLQTTAAVSQSTPQQASAPQIIQQQTPSQAPAPQITVQSADVLGRMLARAAKADPSNATAPAATAPADAGGAPVTPSDLFARLMNVIAQSGGERPGSENGKQSPEFGFAKNALPATQHRALSSNTASPAFAAVIGTAAATAAQPGSLPATPYAVDPQSVIEQVVKSIVMRNSGSTSEVRMRLQPEHLGDVSLKLTVSGNTISANIVAQSADVRDMLLVNQQQLARTLAEAGLSLGNFSVDVSGGNPGFSQQQSPQHRSLSKAGALHAETAAEDDAWADSRFGPPVLAGSKSLVLNYLV
ncbi:MAG TPA: flagellar hook-length control protein FliK [Candidatus Baltobacteraceae bacterium]|nr:flagellar hook-length control protein FliK [Candidatus Baltobacteraceae bacterium]